MIFATASWVVGGVLLGAAAVRSQAPSSASHAPAAAVVAAAAAAAAKAPTPSPTAVPEWEVDENGHRFHLDRIPKFDGNRELPDGSIRTPWGIDFKPVGEDESFYYLRIYDHSDANSAVERPKTTWTPDEIAAIAATYPPPLDRLPLSSAIELEPFDRGLPKAGQWRNGFRFADMNGDGALDLVHGPARKRIGPPLIFLGDRHGTWRRWSEASFPPLAYDYGDVAVADFDGNGTPDLALAIHLKGVLVLVQDGKGRFTLQSEGIPFQESSTDPPGFSSRAIAATDWDRDGRIDVLAAGDGPRMGNAGGTSYGIAWYRNQGGGRWERRDPEPHDFFGETVEVADLDGDGDDDLAVGSSLNGSARVMVLSEGESRWRPTELPQLRSGINPAVAIADLDGDGKPDLAVGHQTYQGGVWRFGLDLFLQRAGFTWERRGVWTEDGQDRLLSIAAGDLDGDGHPDLAAAGANGRVVVLLNQGGATFARVDVTGIESREQGCGGYHVEIADLDGDGLGDLAIGFAGEEAGLTQQLANPQGAAFGCASDGSLRVWRTVRAGRRAGATPSTSG
jgi:hypothetical protein